MVIPNDADGYTLFSIDTSEISPYTSKLLFDRKSKEFYYLFDRLLSSSEELRYISGIIFGVSEYWFRQFRGKILNKLLRAYMLYVDKPQQFGFHGDYIFAANYSMIKKYIQQNIKSIKLHNLSDDYIDRYYKLQIPYKTLLKLSKLFADAMIPLCEKLLPKYRKLTAKDNLSSVA